METLYKLPEKAQSALGCYKAHYFQERNRRESTRKEAFAYIQALQDVLGLTDEEAEQLEDFVIE